MHRSWRMSVESVLYVDADVRSRVCVCTGRLRVNVEDWLSEQIRVLPKRLTTQALYY